MKARTENWTGWLSPKRMLWLSMSLAAGVLFYSLLNEINRTPPPYLRNRVDGEFSYPEEEPRRETPPPRATIPGNIFESPHRPALPKKPHQEPPPPPEPEIPDVILPPPTPTPAPPPTPVQEPRIIRLRYSGMITRINGETRALLTNLETGTDFLLATGEPWEQWKLLEMTPAFLTFKASETVHTLELGQPYDWVQP